MGDVIPYNVENWMNMRFLQDNVKDMLKSNEDGRFNIAINKQKEMYKEFISEYKTIH